MDVAALSALDLIDADGKPQRLGNLWSDRPVIVVFLRHFGCLHCREHAALLGGRAAEVRAHGADLVAIGTGNASYARAFVEDESIPYRVLVDDDASAARAAAVRSTSFIGMFHPRTWAATRETWRRGFRIHRAGRRVTQLGATFIIGPGPKVLYEHVDADSTDHAPLDAVLAALPGVRA